MKPISSVNNSEFVKRNGVVRGPKTIKMSIVINKFCNLFFFPLIIFFSLLPNRSFAAPFNISTFVQSAPLAIIIGALAFGLFGAFIVRKARQKALISAKNAKQQIANLRANLDKYENLLANLPEILIIWSPTGSKPSIYGRPEIIFNNNEPQENIINFSYWLSREDADFLNQHIKALRNKAMGFDIILTALNGQQVNISGHILGENAALRIQNISLGKNISSLSTNEMAQCVDFESTKAILSLLSKPAWIVNMKGDMVFNNEAYLKLISSLDKKHLSEPFPNIFSKQIIIDQINKLAKNNSISKNIELGNGIKGKITTFKIDGAIAGFLTLDEQNNGAQQIKNNAGFEYVEAISLPLAVFDENQKLRHFNSAYCELWNLDEKWLKSGVNETAILNKLHTKSLLPSVVDYRKWRKEHLSSYQLKTARIEEWYLPDGRILNVKSVPIPQNKGVVYIFEDISESRALKMRHNSLVKVQSETLNALSEGVAVFGTNGRLTLSNPRLSELWGIALNELDKNLHIDEIGDLCAKAMPKDGKQIWEKLKKEIIDISPKRSDKKERIKCDDGRLIDYSITRLPDGQTMLTFIDVSKSAAYETMLKERNEALELADRLKDEFVKNISYELRSPLTNIIGFADMLDSEIVGELNKKQREYTSYIRKSSQRLGLLIDNILDLANVDAGIAQLDYSEIDISKIIERAKAGLKGMINIDEGEKEINIEVNIEKNLPPLIADETRIVQILYNLLSNAVRFSDSGSKITLNVSSYGEKIFFTIEDEGEGISEEMRQTIFNRFEGRSSNKYQRGPGLGLAIVKTFVDLHGGNISLEKREPKGTRVIVSLPTNSQQAQKSA